MDSSIIRCINAHFLQLYNNKLEQNSKTKETLLKLSFQEPLN